MNFIAPVTIPTFPARPISGGPLELAGRKVGKWYVEPKYNGWRALVHAPTGTMFNRHGKRLTIEAEFASALRMLQNGLGELAEWFDCEALERRHGIGRGSLIILDHLNEGSYEDRLGARLSASTVPIHVIDTQPLAGCAYLCPAYNDAPDALWRQLQLLNRKWNTTGLNEFYEGIVMKRLDSPYPMQLRSSDHDTHHWMKHRWPISENIRCRSCGLPSEDGSGLCHSCTK